jgi:hypothetical protein
MGVNNKARKIHFPPLLAGEEAFMARLNQNTRL